jgi:hypothetical protein
MGVAPGPGTAAYGPPHRPALPNAAYLPRTAAREL